MSLRTPLVGLLLLFCSSPADAVFIGNYQGGTDFPEGDVSFADTLVSFEPVILNGQPTAGNLGGANALGLPDAEATDVCDFAIECDSVSLGDGGRITLRFVDNALTGSDSSAFDLWIFEVGPDVEDTFVEVSANGTDWSPVGKVFGATAGIDLDAFGFGSSSSFFYVRLTDDGAEGNQTGDSVGADIDAVGAISTRVVPEPGSLALLALGTVALAMRGRARPH